MAGSERWEHVEQLLDRALDLAPADRVAFLNRACEGDPALRTEVDAAAAKSDQFVMDAWRHADPELRPYVDEARAGLPRLSREPAKAGE